jgi:hypothetical protein
VSAQLLFGRRVIAVAGVTQQTAQPQTRHRRDRLDEPERITVGVDSASMEPDVHFDQHVERAAGALHRVRPAAGDVEMIDDDRDRRVVHQRQEARGVDRVDRIRQPDVVDARGDEHFSLADFRAADTHRATLDLPPRDHQRLVRLGVGTKLQACRRPEPLRGIDVPNKPRMIDQYLWSRQIPELHPATVPRGIVTNARRACEKSPYDMCDFFTRSSAPRRTHGSVREPERLMNCHTISAI